MGQPDFRPSARYARSPSESPLALVAARNEPEIYACSGSNVAARRSFRIQLAALGLHPLLEFRDRRRPDLPRRDRHPLEMVAVVGVHNIADASCGASEEVQDVA